MTSQDIYQFLFVVATLGIGTGGIYKGVDFLNWLFTLLPGNVDSHDMPPKARALLSLVLALIVPPIAYAILLVDSGLVAFDFPSLVAVVGASFMSAWALYQNRKYNGS